MKRKKRKQNTEPQEYPAEARDVSAEQDETSEYDEIAAYEAADPGESYSLEDILSEFSDFPDVDANEAEPEQNLMTDPGDDQFDGMFPEHEGDFSDEWETSEAWEAEPVSAESATEPEPTDDATDEEDFESVSPEVEELFSAGAEQGEEALTAQEDTETEEDEVPVSGYVRKRRRVWEEFPDQPADDSAGTGDSIDYTALFHMFAETPQENPEADHRDSSGPERAQEETGGDSGKTEYADEELDKLLGALEQKPAEPLTKPDAAKLKEPLLAEPSLDFRDILREFMMGDQHPIYADMPGIGIKAGEKAPADIPEEAAILTGPENEPAEERKEKTQRRYSVEEDFPLDLSVFESAGEQTRDQDTNENQQTAAVEETTQPEDNLTENKPQKPEKGESGLMKMLRGLGSRTSGNKKKAINEPKAFAKYEDYIDETPETTEPPADSPEDEKPDSQVKPEETGAEAETEEKEGEPTSTEQENPEDDEAILYEGDFPSFGQWILNELMTIWIRINGIGDRASTATMEDEREDLGREVNVANASRYYGSQVTMLRMRFEIGIVLLGILAYLTLGFPVSGMLKTAKVNAAMCLGLQLTIMLLCLDVVTNAAINLTRARFGADSLAVLFCLITSFDALSVAVGGFGNPHIPLCLFSSMSLLGILYASLLSARALRKSIRVPAIGRKVYCVTAEEGVRGGDITLLKSVRPAAGFVRRAEEAPPDESLFSRYAFVELLAAIVLSLLTAVVKHSIGDILYILSAILCCAVPVTALLAFALPYFIGAQRIFSSGAAIAGWSGVHDIGCSRNLIVTDRDLFPEETISIETVRIFADDSAERVIGYAGTMIAASGSGLAPSFAELMEKNGCRMRLVEDFQWLAGGGLQGRIEGHTVLCGSSDLLQLMNVKVPYRLVDHTTVLLAIDGVLYGIFKINYVGLPEIRTALQELIASNRHPIFAIRDFNVTPDLLHEVFDVATDGYDFPPYGDRFRISEAKPSDSSKVSAVVCREGLGPLTHLADTGRSMYVAIRLNLIITAVIAVVGILAVFVKLIGTGEVSAWLPFVLTLLDVIAVTLISLFMRF